MRNFPMPRKAVSLAAELYLKPNTTWRRVAEQLYESYGYPLWSTDYIARKVKLSGLLPEYYCPVCKTERPETDKIIICESCKSKGEQYRINLFNNLKQETKRLNPHLLRNFPRQP